MIGQIIVKTVGQNSICIHDKYLFKMSENVYIYINMYRMTEIYNMYSKIHTKHILCSLNKKILCC